MQKRSKTYQYLAMSLALLIFSTSLGFSMDMHFCKHELKSIGFFEKAKDCYELAGYESPKICKHDHQQPKKTQINKEDCCTNEHILVVSDINMVSPIISILSHNIDFVAILPSQTFLQNIIIPTDNTPYYQYKPPLIVQDIPILNQSFLL